MANPAATSIFVPSTVVSVERSSAQHVSRFASPLRALGARTLGFVDRLLGAHLWSLTGSSLQGEGAVSGRAARITSGGMPMPMPWYELPPRVAAARPSAPQRTASPSRETTATPVATPAALAQETLRQVAESFPSATPATETRPAASVIEAAAPTVVTAVVLPPSETIQPAPTSTESATRSIPPDAVLPAIPTPVSVIPTVVVPTAATSLRPISAGMPVMSSRTSTSSEAPAASSSTQPTAVMSGIGANTSALEASSPNAAAPTAAPFSDIALAAAPPSTGLTTPAAAVVPSLIAASARSVEPASIDVIPD